MSIEELSAEPAEDPTATTTNASRWSKIAATLLTGRWLGLLALPLLFGLYVRAVGFGTVYDDNVPMPWRSLLDVPKLFTQDIFGSGGSAHSVYYRPVATTWGLLVFLASSGTPAWMHLSAILLHVTVMVLAYFFGRRLFRDEPLAILTAVLFGLHPSKVESVAWIGSSYVDGLGAVFFFASLIAFLNYQEKPREGRAAGWMAASVALFAGAMLTKETMVFIPMLIAVYLWLNAPRVERISRIAKTMLPYGVVWIVYMAIRHQVIKPASADAEYIRPTFTLTNVWTAPYAIWWYIRHLALPWGLSVEYATPVLKHPTLADFVLPAMGLLLLLAAALWLWNFRRSKTAAFLIFWFVLTLAPPVIVAPMVSEHDRYLYLAAYAYCALAAWALLRLGKFSVQARLVAALCVVALWSGLTWHEMGYWESDATLWARSLEISPSSLPAQMQTAQLSNEAGDTAKALGILNDGLRYRPNEANLWVVRSSIFQANKQFDEARAGFLKVMQLTEPATGQPAEATAPTQRAVTASLRAVAAYQLAVLDFSTKNFVEAEHFARIALSLNPNGPKEHMILARSLREQGQVQEAKVEDTLAMQLLHASQAGSHAASPLPVPVRK